MYLITQITVLYLAHIMSYAICVTMIYLHKLAASAADLGFFFDEPKGIGRIRAEGGPKLEAWDWEAEKAGCVSRDGRLDSPHDLGGYRGVLCAAVRRPCQRKDGVRVI